jgi:CRP-like cAMP-binding protein
MDTKKILSNCLNCPSFKRSIFKNLEPHQIEKLAQHKVPTTYKKGSTLFHQGNKSYGVHCIANGKIKQSTITDDGRENVKNLSSDGDLLGYRHLFDQKEYPFTAVTIEETSLCFIEKQTLLELIDDSSILSNTLSLKLCQEITHSEAKEIALLYKSVRVRVAQLLVKLAGDFGILVQGKYKLELALSRNEMASMIGMAGETLIRLLTEFKQSGFLEQDGKALYITNIEALKNLCLDKET